MLGWVNVWGQLHPIHTVAFKKIATMQNLIITFIFLKENSYNTQILIWTFHNVSVSMESTEH